MMQRETIRRIGRIAVPTPDLICGKYFLRGPGVTVEVAGPHLNADNRLDKNNVRTFIRKRAKVILSTCENVDGVIADINPHLYAEWWGR